MNLRLHFLHERERSEQDCLKHCLLFHLCLFCTLQSSSNVLSDDLGIIITPSEAFLQVTITWNTLGTPRTSLKHHAKLLFGKNLSSWELRHDFLFKEVNSVVNEPLRNQKIRSEAVCFSLLLSLFVLCKFLCCGSVCFFNRAHGTCSNWSSLNTTVIHCLGALKNTGFCHWQTCLHLLNNVKCTWCHQKQ